MDMTQKMLLVSLLMAASWVADFAADSIASADTTACDTGSHVDDMACQAEHLKTLDAELNRVYQQALAALPQNNAQDIRKGREQLRESQRAWLAYLHANCAFIGGQQGGSNSYVSSFAADCEQKEMTSRITFLKSITASIAPQSPRAR